MDARVKVKACHTNPIFYKVNGSQVQVLNKDSEVELKHSDKFSLLPNSEYEYEVKITEDDNGGAVDLSVIAPASSSAVVMRVRNVLEINVNLEAGNMATSLSQIVGSSANEADTTNIAGMDRDLDRTPSPDMLVAPSDFVEPSSSRGNRKRSLDGDAEGDDENTKRVKSSETPEATVSCSSTSTQPTGSDDATKASGAPPVVIKPDPDSTSSAVTISSSSAVTTSSTLSAPKIKPDPDSSPSTTSSTVASSVPVKKEDPNPTVPTSPAAAPVPRQSCEFGVGCYRNTADHMRDLAHPVDADYRRPTYPPAPADAPNCPWGISCYRRNPDHFRALQHPSSSSNSLKITKI